MYGDLWLRSSLRDPTSLFACDLRRFGYLALTRRTHTLYFVCSCSFFLACGERWGQGREEQTHLLACCLHYSVYSVVMASSGKYPRKVSVKFKKLEVRQDRRTQQRTRLFALFGWEVGCQGVCCRASSTCCCRSPYFYILSLTFEPHRQP